MLRLLLIVVAIFAVLFGTTIGPWSSAKALTCPVA